MLKPNKLVIFDCDGVLINSEVIAARIHAQALTRYGYPITPEESINKFTGLTEHAACQMILEESGIRIPLDYWAQEQPNVFQAFTQELTPLMQPVLESLHAGQISRCVASNSHKEHVTHALKLTKQYDYFNDPSIFTAEQVQKGKPAPDLFFFAAKQMDFCPSDCMVIEDSSAGVEAALAAGMQVIVFLGGGHTDHPRYQEKMRSYNVPITRSCHELLHILEGI